MATETKKTESKRVGTINAELMAVLQKGIGPSKKIIFIASRANGLVMKLVPSTHELGRDEYATEQEAYDSFSARVEKAKAQLAALIGE